MKERPILYSGPMVLGLLEERKTKTRRGVKAKGIEDAIGIHNANMGGPGGGPWWDLHFLDTVRTHRFQCPYGQPGDLLWVKERLARSPDVWTYVADGAEVGWPARRDLASKRLDYAPSIHMPKIASRLTLEITEVGIERLNEITDAEAMAEGVVFDPVKFFHVPGLQHTNPDFPWLSRATAREMFAALWDMINGPGEWLGNPWVWVVSFKAHRVNIETFKENRK